MFNKNDTIIKIKLVRPNYYGIKIINQCGSMVFYGVSLETAIKTFEQMYKIHLTNHEE